MILFICCCLCCGKRNLRRVWTSFFLLLDPMWKKWKLRLFAPDGTSKNWTKTQKCFATPCCHFNIPEDILQWEQPPLPLPLSQPLPPTIHNHHQRDSPLTRFNIAYPCTGHTTCTRRPSNVNSSSQTSNVHSTLWLEWPSMPNQWTITQSGSTSIINCTYCWEPMTAMAYRSMIWRWHNAWMNCLWSNKNKNNKNRRNDDTHTYTHTHNQRQRATAYCQSVLSVSVSLRALEMGMFTRCETKLFYWTCIYLI